MQFVYRLITANAGGPLVSDHKLCCDGRLRERWTRWSKNATTLMLFLRRTSACFEVLPRPSRHLCMSKKNLALRRPSTRYACRRNRRSARSLHEPDGGLVMFRNNDTRLFGNFGSAPLRLRPSRIEESVSPYFDYGPNVDPFAVSAIDSRVRSSLSSSVSLSFQLPIFISTLCLAR